jgi:hypothetical protein
LAQQWLHEAQRYLESNAWVCVGVGNTQALQRLRFWKRSARANKTHLSFTECQKLAPQIEGIYGVHDSLSNPQYFIPLASPAITTFFIEHLMTPKSDSGKLVKKFLLILTKFKLHYAIFSDMVVVIKFP